MQGNGFMAIWSDVATAQETDYLHWLTREHTSERMGVHGFIAVRVFRMIAENVNRFLIVYELEGPEALLGQPYLDRLNNPTPWSQRIMPILGNFIRGGGYRRISNGIGRGGFVAALPWHQPIDWAEDVIAGLAGQNRIAAVHYLETDKSKTSIQTNEKKLRSEDKSFDSLVLVEGLDQTSVRRALDAYQAVLPPGTASSEVPLYSLMFALDGRRWV